MFFDQGFFWGGDIGVFSVLKNGWPRPPRTHIGALSLFRTMPHPRTSLFPSNFQEPVRRPRPRIFAGSGKIFIGEAGAVSEAAGRISKWVRSSAFPVNDDRRTRRQ